MISALAIATTLVAAVPVASIPASKEKITLIKAGTIGTPALKVNPPAPKGGNGGATAPGVTATSINIGQVMSLSGPNPGVFQEVVTDAQAYANYVNSLGGVYGRKINITVGDDAYDVVKDQAVCAKLIPQSFAIVASFAFGETGCYPQLKSSGIPWVSNILYDARMYSLPNVVAPKPNSYSNLEQILEIDQHKGTPIKKVWLCEIQAPGIAAQAAPEAAVWESLGVQVLNLAPLPANATDYTAEVVQAKEAGADAVDCFSTPTQIDATIAQEMAQQGWDPPIKRGYAVYDPNFVKLAGPAGKGWTTSLTTPALNYKALTATPGGKLYSKWLDKETGKPIPPNSIGVSEGWVEMALFVQGLVKAGPDLTQAKLLAALKTIKNFSADGIVPPFTQWHEDTNDGCLAIVGDTGNALAQVYPKAGYLACGGQLFS